MTAAMSDKSYCAIHERDEEFTGTSYKFCFECGHIWQTCEEFAKDINVMLQQPAFKGSAIATMELPQDLDGFPYCPLCLHDFIF